jgi:hypothetical protein
MMIDLSKLTYYEVETLKELVDSKIKLEFKMADRHPSIYSRREQEMDDLMLLKIKLSEFLSTLPEPSVIERMQRKNKKRR